MNPPDEESASGVSEGYAALTLAEIVVETGHGWNLRRKGRRFHPLINQPAWDWCWVLLRTWCRLPRLPILLMCPFWGAMEKGEDRNQTPGRLSNECGVCQIVGVGGAIIVQVIGAI